MRAAWLILLVVPAVLAAQNSTVPSVRPVQLKSGKQSFCAVEVQPPGKGPFPAVLMLHGDFGLTHWVRKQANRLADRGYVVLAVDLYEGELPKTIEEAHILERGLDERRVLAHVKAGADHLQSLANVRKQAIGVIGWDSGAGYALDAAIGDPRIKTTVICYGRLTTDAERLAKLEGPVLALFGGKDEGIPPATIEQFRKAMAGAGKPVTIHVYPECGSSFMDPTSPYVDGSPNQAAIADAWAKIDAALDRTLKK